MLSASISMLTGVFSLGVSAEVVARLDLEVEQELQPEQLEELHGSKRRCNKPLSEPITSSRIAHVAG